MRACGRSDKTSVNTFSSERETGELLRKICPNENCNLKNIKYSIVSQRMQKGKVVG